MLLQPDFLSSPKSNESGLGYNDPFCQLPNRTALRQTVQRALAQPGEPASFSLVVLVLDSLATVNARYGMSTGDAYLYAWAQRLRALLSVKGQCFYVFGSHFAIVLPNAISTSRESLQHILQDWREVLQRPFQLAEKRLEVSISMGVADCPFDGSDFDELFANASAARFEAKRQGGEAISFYSPDEHVRSISQTDVIADLSSAIENDEFVLHYQPTLDLRTRKIVGLEALIRWQHPTRGMVPPIEFIPTAEDTGLIMPIGRWLLSQVLMDRKAWKLAHGDGAKMSFNVSPRELAEQDFIEGIDMVFDQAGGNQPELEIEITENVMVQHPERSARILRRLQGRGFRIAIDDFGAGYASLLYLQQFPVDKIKIDRLYIDGVLGKRRERAIVVAAIQLATDLSSDVVAEGVESQDQVDALLDMGCHQMQGYHFCRPMPLPDLIAWADEFYREKLQPA